jgi:hypothetical protein
MNQKTQPTNREEWFLHVIISNNSFHGLYGATREAY